MTEQEMEDRLADLLTDPDTEGVEFVSTFEQDGIMTNNKGLVVQTDDGSEFQLTIVKSR